MEILKSEYCELFPQLSIASNLGMPCCLLHGFFSRRTFVFWCRRVRKWYTECILFKAGGEQWMRRDELTVKDALKYARHDFLNELQYILLNLDLDRQSETRQAILNATNRMRQFAFLERLGLPKTELWLLTFGWTYNSFTYTLHCDVTVGTRAVDDQRLVTFLETVFSSIEQQIDPMEDYDIHIFVSASPSEWELQFVLTGRLRRSPEIRLIDELFSVQQVQEEDEWILTIQGN